MEKRTTPCDLSGVSSPEKPYEAKETIAPRPSNIHNGHSSGVGARSFSGCPDRSATLLQHCVRAVVSAQCRSARGRCWGGIDECGGRGCLGAWRVSATGSPCCRRTRHRIVRAQGLTRPRTAMPPFVVRNASTKGTPQWRARPISEASSATRRPSPSWRAIAP